MHPLALWFLVFLSGGSQRIVNQVCLSQQWVLLSSRDVEVEERGRGREREIVPDLTFLCDTCNRREAGSAVPPRFHRIILRMPLERFLLLLLSKQYCWQCNICLDSSPGCNFQLNLFPPSGDLKLEESKWATNFFFLFFVFLCREAFIWTCLGIVSGVHSGLALPLLTECQLGRDLNGLKWSLQWGVCCREGRREARRAGIQTDGERQTGRKKERERETKTQSNRTVSLFIDSHVCTDEFLSVPWLGPHAVFRPQHDWLIWLIYLAAQGC